MKNSRKYSVAIIALNLLLAILAFQGVFNGKDVLPILLGGIIAFSGLILLLLNRKKDQHFQGLLFSLILISSFGPYYVHFNVYNHEKISASQNHSLQILHGEVAPDLTYQFKFNSSDSFRLSKYSKGNKYTILNFWATWCAPCLKEMPMLNEFYQSNKDRKFGILGFTDFSDHQARELKKISNTINKLQVSYPILVDKGTKVRASYMADVLPATVLLHNEGRVLDYQIGLEGTEKILEFVQDNL